ncbi:DivIVA domain-containing protein [Saccharopolyspora griseoalba]|uniref:Uncharacterized protein n=1 Tax=Saccharopolyspora griseoalba TaxID=1431848 RepID=A0ABW2LMA6_9PSEU
MEDADAVVPLRPGFDIQMRGFSRNQVIEHIEVLEDQLRMVTIDRNEAVRLNNDLRKLCEDTRRSLDESESRLKRIESSDTGLPAASQRVQNMLSMAEDEVQQLRDRAKRQAEIIRGKAETEARALITDAEQAASELRDECNELVTDVEERRAELQREHEQKLSEQRNREYRMRQGIRNEYKKVLAQAQEEADALVAETHQQCSEWDAETERMRLEALEEIRAEREKLERLRSEVLEAVNLTREKLDSSVGLLHLGAPADGSSDGSAQDGAEQDGEVETAGIVETPDADSAPEVTLPEQREDTRTYTISLNPEHTTNGASQASPGVRQN